VRLNDPAVSRRHATPRLTDDGWQITGRGSNPTLVNAVPIEGAKALRDGDTMGVLEEAYEKEQHALPLPDPVEAYAGNDPQAA